MAGVPLQTEHKLMHVEHQQHAIVCATRALSSNFLFVHILYRVATCIIRIALFRAAFQTVREVCFNGYSQGLSCARGAA